ncbi:hypothetical protein [Pinirhizobacter sp.]|jgi:hypothetical protein|uniref:hypothetical protein n=1 Tax=Pinirhizobacter sp. TaxID=2950432 RepID=UPI002F42FA87
MAHSRIERILILAKTYPSPSSQYVETSCVAGITEQGCMRRLYPVPFRLVEDRRQFKKWQWVDVRVSKPASDRRPESHRIYVDTLECGSQITTKDDWIERRRWIDNSPSFGDFASLDTARLDSGLSLGILRPNRILCLDIQPSRSPHWTSEEREKLKKQQMELFSEADARRDMQDLRKIPHDFYYHYLCRTSEGDVEYRHKIVDWEIGALYWNCLRNHGKGWEAAFRRKIESELPARDLMFLMGNLHRFQDQWLIVSLIYPPKRAAGSAQGALF